MENLFFTQHVLLALIFCLRQSYTLNIISPSPLHCFLFTILSAFRDTKNSQLFYGLVFITLYLFPTTKYRAHYQHYLVKCRNHKWLVKRLIDPIDRPNIPLHKVRFLLVATQSRVYTVNAEFAALQFINGHTEFAHRLSPNATFVVQPRLTLDQKPVLDTNHGAGTTQSQPTDRFVGRILVVLH